MRDRIFSRVLLPAPFRPIMPTTSPCLTSKLTSFRAMNCSTSLLRNGWRSLSSIVSAMVECFTVLRSMRYALETPRMEIARSDDIGEPPFHALESDRPHDKDQQRDHAGVSNPARIGRG